MAAIKPSVPKGTRDFSPVEMTRRNYIFDTIKSVFRKYGYQQIETPSMENISTLTGKYGDEGDKLIFKILNSGELLSTNITEPIYQFQDSINRSKTIINTRAEDSDLPGEEGDKRAVTRVTDPWAAASEIDQLAERRRFLNRLLTSEISEKALRYDLTVPFARYVVMHQNEITFPFKRFQVQPVWRADRPQKGRYREFYQCDADVVGSDSLLNEAEFVMIYDEALSALGLKDFTVKINNRKILSGIAEIIGKPELIVDMTVAIDKLDKIGMDGVVNELLGKGFTQDDVNKLEPIILLEGSNYDKLHKLRQILTASAIGLKGCEELETIFEYLNRCKLQRATLELDITLARGLNYYTGAIFEVKTNETFMGSIGGGGRYDNLTGMFDDRQKLTGAGISFGADRIYDVLLELGLFPESAVQTTKVLICCFDKAGEEYALPLLQQLRAEGVNSELYPAGTKIKKQFDYANSKRIPYVIVIGSEEIESGLLTVKHMDTGAQDKLTVNQVLSRVK